ncbi:outer membrane protein, multidrug efflux system [Methylophilus rhizosphaerae]|uniref:Outer membrane protein, multidrug efflux system n=2 Tax=Methylophilus rhizosphaerae TaxID=492660 RepID=A0A1G9BR23_9PROT|nr:efflux transporter outer membrane subunit [Methylophilus rhizosphaerae]SDK41604.1 outer membrane protein, multidrug efflux system [Methylophilus rhizosphaerae]
MNKALMTPQQIPLPLVPAFRYMALIATSLVLTSCIDLAPFYQRPAAPVPATFGQAEADQKALTELAWRSFITDQRLQQVIDLSLNNNRDLKVASLTIEKSRALYQVQRADLFPTIAASLSETASKGMASAANNVAGNTAGAATGTAGSSNSSGKISHVYRASVGFSAYELDLFGRIRNLNEQALQTFYADEENRKSTQISLIAEVATAWLTLAADKMRLDIAQQTLHSQQATYDINQKMFDLGVANALTLKQLQTSVDTARVAVATYNLQIQQDVNALNLLAGSAVPAALLPDGKLANVALTTPLPRGVSSETLQQRPDVRAAEHLLQGANANIGALRAAFFPTISLTTTVGTASTELNGLFHSGSSIWTFVPQISVPIFNAGRNRANLTVGEKNQQILLAQYEKTVQTAFREVADVLVQREGLQAQIEAQTSLTDAAAEAFKLADARFKNGIDSYLVVLDAQRTLYTAQQSLVTLQLNDAASQLTLYKTMGGGWH